MKNLNFFKAYATALIFIVCTLNCYRTLWAQTIRVEIVEPANNHVDPSPADIGIHVRAFHGNGTKVKRIQLFATSATIYPRLHPDFYIKQLLDFYVKSDVSSPIDIDTIWTKVLEGNYLLIAKAVDDLDVTVYSDPVIIKVQNTAPVVNLIEPENDKIIITNNTAPLVLKATATDDDGILNVSLFKRTPGQDWPAKQVQTVNSDVNSPNTFTFTELRKTIVNGKLQNNELVPGNYEFVARAKDKLGKFGESNIIKVTVIKNDVPKVNLTKAPPASGDFYHLGETIKLTADVTNMFGEITSVKFTLTKPDKTVEDIPNTNNVNPYTASFTAKHLGIHTVTVKATDELGLQGSASILIRIFSPRPKKERSKKSKKASTTITNSKNNAITPPATINLNATAPSANVTISKPVEVQNVQSSGVKLDGDKKASIKSLTNHIFKTGIKAYPNPTDGRNIIISLIDQPKGTYNVILINNLGQVVHQTKIDHPGGSFTQTLRFSNKLNSGLYTLRVTNGQNTSNIKILSN
jgi:hypothetical protein